MSETTTNPAEGEDLSPESEVELEIQDGDGEQAEPELDDDGNPIPPSEEDEDFEELEHDGQKYALPKALKPLLLMQADYTKKTQAIAEQARANEERQAKLDAALSTAQETDQAIRQSERELAIKDHEMAQYDQYIEATKATLRNVDWNALAAMRDSDGQPIGQLRYQQAQAELQALIDGRKALEDNRTKLAGDLDAKVKARGDAVQARALEQQQATAKLIEDRDAALKAKFPKWSEEYPEIQAFVTKTFGIPAEDVAKTPNPALLEIARYAKLGFEAEQRDRTAKAAAKRVLPATQGAAPVRKVAGASTPSTDMNRLGTDAWMKARRDEVAKKGRR